MALANETKAQLRAQAQSQHWKDLFAEVASQRPPIVSKGEDVVKTASIAEGYEQCLRTIEKLIAPEKQGGKTRDHI